MRHAWAPVSTEGAHAVEPAHEDAFVRGVSQAIGGPLGSHAARRGRLTEALWTPARVVITLALLTFTLHWVQKSPCQDGAWANFEQYTRYCYTDVLALYYAEQLSDGAVPYVDHAVEYPVLTGYLMGAIGLPVHAYGQAHPDVNQGQLFWNLNFLVLGAFGIASIAVVLALRRRRPWDAALFALAPTLLVTATVNWDLFAGGLTAFFLLAWARRWPVLAGVMLGLAGAAKFYPLFLAGPLIVLALRSGRWRAAALTVATTAGTWAAANAPVYLYAHAGWQRFWQLSSERPIDWGTFWYIGAHFPVSPKPGGGLPPFDWLGGHIPVLNNVIYVLFGLACLGIAALAFAAPRRPRLAQLCFLVVAVFLLTSKVWSQQFVLWLIPLAVLARPRWGAFLVWQIAEIGYFLAFYGELLNVSGRQVFPETTFVLAASGRWLTLAILVGFVVRDILRPELDVVRHAYDDDPDGGDFDGAPDGPIMVGLRSARATGGRSLHPG
ncbi:MAG: glycosyltransferase family 87 protein [Micromonosporaceae bacterium]